MAFGSDEKKAKFKLKLGDRVKDRITGFTGIIIGRTQWLHNCNTYLVKSETLKDEKPIDAQNFDEPQLEVLEKKVVEPMRATGGPTETVKQTNR